MDVDGEEKIDQTHQSNLKYNIEYNIDSYNRYKDIDIIETEFILLGKKKKSGSIWHI